MSVPVEKGYEPFQAMCLATLRKDGFVSLTAGQRVGELVTKPFVASGDQLLLNVDVQDGGEVRVEILDDGERPIHGFELSRSIRLTGRSIQQAVDWRGEANWSQLAGRKVHLRIQLRNADLYAHWTAKKE